MRRLLELLYCTVKGKELESVVQHLPGSKNAAVMRVTTAGLRQPQSVSPPLQPLVRRLRGAAFAAAAALLMATQSSAKLFHTLLVRAMG